MIGLSGDQKTETGCWKMEIGRENGKRKIVKNTDFGLLISLQFSNFCQLFSNFKPIPPRGREETEKVGPEGPRRAILRGKQAYGAGRLSVIGGQAPKETEV